MESEVIEGPRWWQWPTVLSLDAPLVAVAWQGMIARSSGSGLRPAEIAVLGLSVWLAYAADRWFEGCRLAEDRVMTQRHRFYQRHRWGLATAWIAILATDLTVAFQGLSHSEFKLGLLLLGPVLLYLLSHQLFHREHPWRVPKEICVALLLGAGATLFPASRAGLHRIEIPAGLFTLLCLANCALISVWEHGVDLTQGQTSLVVQFRLGARAARILPWVILAGALALMEFGPAQARETAFLASASAAMLGLVDLAAERIGRKASRVLADAVLLTPLIAYAFRGF